MSNVIGVDIGGTNVKIGVINENYECFEYLKFKTNKDDIPALFEDICAVVNLLKNKHNCDTVGIGSPGQIRDGIIVEAGNLAYDNTPAVDIVTAKTGLNVYLDNDANCALYGEKFAGAGKYVDDMLVLTIGTGIGGGIMINRKCYKGHNGRAGELGHFVIDINGKPCSCGLRGCFEQYASVTAFTNSAREAVEKHPDSILFEMANGDVSKIGGRLPFKAMYRGCELSKKIIDDYICNLAYGINSLTKIFQPQVISLTGGIINEGDIILDLLQPHLCPTCNCVLSPLDGKAGLIGAALIKKERESYR